MPRRAMGPMACGDRIRDGVRRWRYAGVSSESGVFPIDVSRFWIGSCPARPPIGTYEILREDTR